MSEEQWTATDVRNILNNPIYAGVGPPAIVPEEQWLTVATRLIGEIGDVAFISNAYQLLTASGLEAPSARPKAFKAKDVASEVLWLARETNPAAAKTATRRTIAGHLVHEGKPSKRA